MEGLVKVAVLACFVRECDRCQPVPSPLSVSNPVALLEVNAMRLLTCNGCKFSGDCDHARHLRTSLKLFGIRSLKFACAKRENVFAPGQPVIFQTWTTEDDGDDDRRRVEVTYPGYVIEQMGGKVFGFIEPGTADAGGEEYPFEPKAGGYVKMPLSRVRADSKREPGDARRCGWCSSHPGVGAGCGYDPAYTPRGVCLKPLRVLTPAI